LRQALAIPDRPSKSEIDPDGIQFAQQT